MIIREVSIYSPDAVMLIGELNRVLIGIVGNNGTRHVNPDDFEQPGSAFFVGYDMETPMCCAGIRAFSNTVGEIKRVYTRPNDKKLAASLMSQLEAWAGAHGYEKLILECREINSHAIRFYEKNGYRVCAQYPPYEDQPDAVCMEKALHHQTEDSVI